MALIGLLQRAKSDQISGVWARRKFLKKSICRPCVNLCNIMLHRLPEWEITP